MHVVTGVDMHRALAWLASTNDTRGVTERLLPVVLLLKATALALRDVPELNATWVGGRAAPLQAIDLAINVALRDGRCAEPVLREADHLSLDALMDKLGDLVARARNGLLAPEEISHGAVGVTSLGERGIDAVFAPLAPPRVATVGFGRITERPLSIGGEIVAGPVCTASLTADARVADPHRAARFLSALERLLQEPEEL